MSIAHSSIPNRPIGIFDSGVGGLTVLKSLMAAMPGEEFLYLGDTARVPYGTKSSDTIQVYSTGLAKVLLRHDVKMIIIACNTASAHATQIVREQAAPVPVIGMIEPAAEAAVRATRNKKILVMGTQSTIRSGCYTRAIHGIDPAVIVHGVPAQMLVALAEENWLSGPIAQGIVREYIGSYFSGDDRPDTIILGCTHFPLLRDVIAGIAGPGVALIDNGSAVVDLLNPGQGTGGEPARVQFMVTDTPARFAPLAQQFLGRPVPEESVVHIDLAGFDNHPAQRHSVGV
ncbi:MAG TPA: glutamate racemase [Micavibrio sp.]|jgi:glutamate racemase